MKISDELEDCYSMYFEDDFKQSEEQNLLAKLAILYDARKANRDYWLSIDN